MLYESQLLSSSMQGEGECNEGWLTQELNTKSWGLDCFVGKSLMLTYLGILFLVTWTLKEN